MKGNAMRRQTLSLFTQRSHSQVPCLFIVASRSQKLHTSPSSAANPLPHPVAPGPPPKPPQPSASLNDERVARKRKQAELLERGRALRANPAKPSTTLQKRFWKDVTVQETKDGYVINLDKRPVRTLTKQVITVPLNKPHLATAVALEWDLLVSASQALKRQYIPMTSLVSRAMDIEAADKANDIKIRDSIVKSLMGYLTTDTLLCWAPSKNVHDDMERDRGQDSVISSQSRPYTSLRQQQEAVATPIISFLTKNVWPGVEINPVLDDGTILARPQPEMTQHVVRGWLTGLSAWDLAGVERAALASKSLCIASRLLVEWSALFAGSPWRQSGDVEDESPDHNHRFGIEDAAEACSLEVRWQTGMWGEVEDTHDVEREDVRMQLGSVVLLVNGEK